MSSVSTNDPRFRAAIRNSIQAHKQVAEYQLPSALDRQMLEWGERKEFLSPAEHAQLMALVDFSQQRTIEKLQAELALKELKTFFPDEAA
jgi:hypothetical protein